MEKVSVDVLGYAYALNNIGKEARDKHFALLASKKK